MILFCLDEFASFGKLQITEALRKLRKRHIRIMVLTQSVADLDMIYGKDERKAMLGNFKFTVLLGCKDTETQEYFSKMIGEKHTLLVADTSQKPQPIIKPADLAHLEHDLIVICDDGAVRLHKNFYFKWRCKKTFRKRQPGAVSLDFPSGLLLFLWVNLSGAAWGKWFSSFLKKAVFLVFMKIPATYCPNARFLAT